MRWMIDGQLGRRNLTPVARIAVAKKYEDKLKEKARENQLSGLKQNHDNRSVQMDNTDTVETRQEIARLANVGTGTLARYDVVRCSYETKQGKVYGEYEKLCGVRQGSAGKVSLERNSFALITQETIAKELGLSVATNLRFYKSGQSDKPLY